MENEQVFFDFVDVADSVVHRVNCVLLRKAFVVVFLHVVGQLESLIRVLEALHIILDEQLPTLIVDFERFGFIIFLVLVMVLLLGT